MISIEGQITEATAASIKTQLESSPGAVSLKIDSPGGDLFAGLQIYDMLSDRDVTIHVKRAGSVASIIALAGKQLPTVQQGGGFAIHNAHVENTKGNHHDLRTMADSLEKYSQIVARIYTQKTKLTNKQALSLMDDSTMISAEDAIELGFASSINTAALVSNNYESISQINNIDMSLLDRVKNNLGMTAEAPTVAEPVNVEEVETTDEAGFTEAQLAQVTELVNTVVAEALAGAPSEEEIGNTIAVVLNSLVSKGTPPASAQISNSIAQAPSAMDAFNKKMNEIKERK